MVHHSAIGAYRGSVLNVKLSNILLPEDNNNNDSFIPYPGRSYACLPHRRW